MSAHVRPARAGDAPLIHILIAELAEYEQLAHEAKASITDLDAALFGLSPRVFADIAEVDDVAVGMALWFYSFSTFTGRHGIYLEDLFGVPQRAGAVQDARYCLGWRGGVSTKG